MEFVRVNYPKSRRVLLDGDDFKPTNRTFEVERGTHSFAIDEPAEPPDITEFIELTSQQSPRELSFTPAFGFVSLGVGTRSIGGIRGISSKSLPKKEPAGRKKRAAKPAAKRQRTKAKAAAKAKRPAKRTTKKRGRK